MEYCAVDLFAGAGGMSQGLTSSGINVVAAYESWDAAVDTYNANFTTHAATRQNLADEEDSIKKISEHSPDIIVGGPPCQDFSSAGTQIEGTRASLTVSYATIVARVQPQCFVMENVPNARKSKAYGEAQEIFKTAGYGLTELVLDASFFGVPQRRKRLVVIGILHGDDGIARNAIEKQESFLPVTVRQRYPEFPVEYYYRHPRSYARRAVFSIDEPAPTVRGSNRPKPSNYTPHLKDATTSADLRALTYQERALLQTFPKDFDWKSHSKTDIEQMIGNAVPIEMARRIGEALKLILSGESEKRQSFGEWLRTDKKDTDASARDVVSRLRRAAIMTSKTDQNELDEDDILRAAEEEGMKPAVLSQVLRARNLWQEYIESQSEAFAD
ncbi:MAG: DNA cytosine methyltransferase [Bifidobacterium psychraerophilum]|uniref:DNA cytosine methyltransferase n=1 Tax=Bifidobacterium psychraerophilum TaxID=218140 RepID=UPI0039E8B608